MSQCCPPLTILQRVWDPDDPSRSYHHYSTLPDTAPPSQDRGSKPGTRISAKAGKSRPRLQPRAPESEWWRGARMIPGGALSGSTRRRIRRLGASRRPIHLCARGGGRVGVRRDLSGASSTSLSHGTGVDHGLTYKIGVVGVRAESDIRVGCVALRQVSGELPELSI